MTKTSNRPRFLSTYADKQIPAEKLRQDPAVKQAMVEEGKGRSAADLAAAADLNRDGMIKGQAELDKLYTSLDRHDRSGSAQTITVERSDGSTTPQGKVLNRLSLLAENRALSASTKLTFAEGRDPAAGKTISLSFVGDLLLHSSVQKSAEKSVDPSIQDPTRRGASGFEELMKGVKEELGEADLTIANLEVPLAEGLTKQRYRDSSGRLVSRKTEVAGGDYYDGRAYTNYPVFNAHPSFGTAVANLGIDVVTTANNHALDRASNGVDSTLDALDKAGVGHVGTARHDPSSDAMPFHGRFIKKTVDGVEVGILSYTDLINVGAGKDEQDQVSEFRDGKYLEDIKRAREQEGVDLVVVAPHWGKEDTHTPTSRQRALAQKLVDAGADVVVGSHPHVLQPVEKLVARDGREAVVAYSLGNFFSGQNDTAARESIILNLGITKPEEGRAYVNNMTFTPTFVEREGGRTTEGRVYRPVVLERGGEHAGSYQNIIETIGARGNVQDPDKPLGETVDFTTPDV